MPNPPTKMKSQPNPEKANEFKIRGNDCVKAGQYQKAIHYYTEAIRLNKFEPIYFSNRALCNLKLQRLLECIEDCTIAIGIDEGCVKAYYRRAQAREQMNERHDEALSDYEKVLKLEPKNMDAKKSIEKLRKLLTEQKGQKAAVVEPTKQQINQNNTLKRESAKTANKAEASAVWSKYEQDKDFKPIDFVPKPAHLQSKTPLKRIKIVESKTSDRDENENVQTTSGNVQTKTKEEKKGESSSPKQASAIVIPKTTAEFYKSWSSSKGSHQKSEILKGINRFDVAKLLGSQFEVTLLAEILDVLNEHFVPDKVPIAAILKGIVNNSEISIIALLMSDDDKEKFIKLIDYMRTNGEDVVDVNEIDKKFKHFVSH